MSVSEMESKSTTYVNGTSAAETGSPIRIHDQSALPPAPEANSATLGTELAAYGQALKHYWYVTALCTITALVVVFALSKVLTPLYSASATIRIAEAASGDVASTTSQLFTRLSNTFVQLAESQPIQDELARKLGRDTPLSVDVRVVTETELLQITATDQDPQVARDTANTLAQIMIEHSMNLYHGDGLSESQILATQMAQTQNSLNQALTAYNAAQASQTQAATSGTSASAGLLDLLNRTVTMYQDIYANLMQRYTSARIEEQLYASTITVADPAELPLRPSIPNIPLNLALGLIGGLGAGIALSFILDALDNTIRTVTETQTITALPLVALVPYTSRRHFWRKSNTVLYGRSQNRELDEAYRRLQVRLSSDHNLEDCRIILIASPEPETGTSLTAANLALAMAEAGQQVVLIDANVQAPKLDTIFHVRHSPGLLNVLSGKMSVAERLYSSSWPNLRLMPVGESKTPISALVNSGSFNRLFHDLRTADAARLYVIIDSPALATSALATALARYVDTVLLVVGCRFTHRTALRFALRQFEAVDAPLGGLIINRLSLRHADAPKPYHPRTQSPVTVAVRS